jgi:protein-S-isoprenylcysteine O-methyltransferase Ste14
MHRYLPPPLVLALLAAAMWGADRLLPALRIESSLLSAWLKPLAIVLFIAGLLLAAAAVTSFITHKTTINPLAPSRASHLISRGVYAYSRNPIYLADLLLLIALALWLGNPVNMIGPVLFVAFINQFQITPEEQALARLFGEHYAAYRARVRRWL